MGWETVVMAGLSAVKGITQMNQAKSEAKALVREGEIAAGEQAKKTRYKAAAQTSSFLNAGLTLEGTPNSVLNETYQTGLADINNIITGYNTKSKNAISKGRSDMINSMVSDFKGADFGGGSMGSMFEIGGSYLPESFAYGLNNAGYGSSAYNMLRIKDERG